MEALSNVLKFLNKAVECLNKRQILVSYLGLLNARPYC